MFTNTLYPKTAQVLSTLTKANVLKSWYLAGGTALALQLGHRKSIDLDFFSTVFPNRDRLLVSLKEFSPIIIQEAVGTLDLIIDTVKVSFLEYNYPILEKGEKFENVELASIIDIACMKLSAISSRGSRKDFIDLYFILKKISLKEIFLRFATKYSGIEYSDLHMQKSLVYFADADKETYPDMIEKVTWEEIKKYFMQLR